ncbi:MAG: hypothetical protein GEU96_15155 [Propionibacteriales bacterium]|nr:hypothetical protein [Propionibacteriales bacterium]
MTVHATDTRSVLRHPRRIHRPVNKPHRTGPGPYGGGGHRPGGDSEGRPRRPRRNWPVWAAVLVTVLLAAALTVVGMVAQILANLAGAQLPGA